MWTFPETLHLLPDERRRRRVLPRYLLADARDAASFGGLLAVRNQGTVVGAAVFLPPEAQPVSAGRELRSVLPVVPALPWAIGAAREGAKGRRANRAQREDLPPHSWLRVIGVAPDHQGEGIGTALVDAVLVRADRAGTGCFLYTATEANVAWYRRFGFDIRATYHPTPSWPQVWAMWRHPVDAS